MMEKPGPLAPEIDALLDAERRVPDAPADARARVLARVEATLALGGAATPAAAGLAAALAARPVVAVLAALAVGGLTGAGIYRWTGSAGRAAPVAAPAAIEAPRPAAPATLAEPPAAPAVRPPDAVPAAPRASNRPTKRSVQAIDDLEAERIVLQEARAHVAAGHGRAALDAIDRHARQFSDGALAEEREALAVKALLLLAETDAARTRAARFRQRHPRSIYLPAVEQALESVR
jgi:hypothetical protein